MTRVTRGWVTYEFANILCVPNESHNTRVFITVYTYTYFGSSSVTSTRKKYKLQNNVYCMNVYKRTDDGSQLELKHVAVIE